MKIRIIKSLSDIKILEGDRVLITDDNDNPIAFIAHLGTDKDENYFWITHKGDEDFEALLENLKLDKLLVSNKSSNRIEIYKGE